MSKMITAVVMVDGRWRLMKLQLLSTEVEFLMFSATSFVGLGGGREALHMLDVWWVVCQWSRQERGGGQLVGSLLCHPSTFLQVKPQFRMFSHVWW